MGRKVQRRLQPLRRRRRKKERKKGIEKHIFRNKKRETSCVQTSLMKTTRNPPSSSLQSSEAELAFCGDIILTPTFFSSRYIFCSPFVSFFLSFCLSSSPPRKEREREREGRTRLLQLLSLYKMRGHEKSDEDLYIGRTLFLFLSCLQLLNVCMCICS